MSKKVMLTTRLEPELIARLNEVAASKYLPIDATISAALDAFDREQNMAESLADRVEKFESTVSRLVDVIVAQDDRQRTYLDRDNERMVFLVDKIYKALYQANLAHQFQLFTCSPEIKEGWKNHQTEKIDPTLRNIKLPD
jgi:hypothetical protein